MRRRRSRRITVSFREVTRSVGIWYLTETSSTVTTTSPILLVFVGQFTALELVNKPALHSREDNPPHDEHTHCHQRRPEYVIPGYLILHDRVTEAAQEQVHRIEALKYLDRLRQTTGRVKHGGKEV